jgi:hypothetical protein
MKKRVAEIPPEVRGLTEILGKSTGKRVRIADESMG